MSSWWFRTKPRSILKTFKWFPHFAELEGQNWNYREDTFSNWNDKPVNLIRREFIYRAHWEELEERYDSYEQFMAGTHDINEIESTGRNDKTTFEFYGLGYVDGHGNIKVTKAGNLVKSGKMDENILLKLLLKLQFPSPVTKKGRESNYVFPLEIILNIYKYFDDLNKFELGYLFMCNDIEKIGITIKAIREFKKRYKELENKTKLPDVVSIFTEIMKRYFPEITNKPETYYRDYSDALIRTLEYTGLFSQRGRSYYVKLFIPEHAKMKVKLLQDQYEFIYKSEERFEEYMEWYGNPYNILLPWEEKNNIRLIIDKKLEIYKRRLNEAEKKITNFKAEEKINEIIEIQEVKIKNEDMLLELDKDLSQSLLSLNEELFVKYNSKTAIAREEIIEKFIDILEGNEDMSALWLECNTWKSLVAINGSHYVKRNFKVEEDLSPRAFAPGIGNTPDMELYENGYILIPEVSLMTGVRQWEHEGSSVIDHVFKFIKQYEEKQVIGIFISSAMNIRTIWQFFILNRESWMGKPVPVVPITIKQYIGIIDFLYKNDLHIRDFKELVENIHKDTFNYSTFKEWEENIDTSILKWKTAKAS